MGIDAVPQECTVDLREQHDSLNRSLFLCLSVLDTYSETNNPNINGGRGAALKGLADRGVERSSVVVGRLQFLFSHSAGSSEVNVK